MSSSARRALAGVPSFRFSSTASARRALEDIRLYEELKLTGAGEDFARIKQEIKQRYNLEEK